eukprot:scaffold153828_cov39-Prasinocladus_malaysianus.AAC.2
MHACQLIFVRAADGLSCAKIRVQKDASNDVGYYRKEPPSIEKHNLESHALNPAFDKDDTVVFITSG